MLITLRNLFVYTTGALLIMSSPALADQTPPVSETVAITGNVLANAAGVVRVNQTAGNGNVQANVAVIGNGGAPTVHQSTAMTQAETGRTSIDDFAFSGVNGILQINQSAGTGNAQANVVYVSDNALSAALPQQSVPTGAGAPSGANAVSIAKTAFANAKGLVQISQTAGTSNRTANTFVLQLPSVAGH